jgi:hypothetical protein
MVERASNTDRARYVRRTSPSAHRRKDQTITISEKDQTQGGPSLSIKVGHAGLSKAYDPATGSGDGTFTSYLSGKCVGATFMGSTNVTNVNSTGTYHFVASDDGKRVDTITTSATDPIGGVGDFFFVGTGLRQ